MSKPTIFPIDRHSREGGNPGQHRKLADLPWIPVSTGMTVDEGNGCRRDNEHSKIIAHALLNRTAVA